MIGNILSIFSILVELCIIPTVWLVYKKKLTFLNGVFLGTFLFLVSFGCSVFGTSVMYGYSPIDYAVNGIFDDIMAGYNTVSGISKDEIQAVSNIIAMVKELYFTLMPTIVITLGLVWAYVILMIFKGAFALFRKDVSGFWRFCDFKMPRTAIFLAVISYLLSIVFDAEQIGYAFLNFASIIFIITSVCGLSVIDYGVRKKIRISVLRALIYIIIFGVLTVFMGIGTSLLTFVGMFDSVFDIRNAKVKINKS